MHHGLTNASARPIGRPRPCGWRRESVTFFSPRALPNSRWTLIISHAHLTAMLGSIPGFISYSSNDRQRAAEVKVALTSVGVDAFMAHDDIHISQQWRDRILAELAAMKVFVVLLSNAFRQSDWTAQEVGVAVGRSDVLIIPVSLDGTVPFGFIAAIQSRPLPTPVSPDFFRDAVAARFPRAVIARLIDRLANSGGFRSAEHNFRGIMPFIDHLTADEAERIAIASTENRQIWDAADCRSDYLPEFIEKNRHQLTRAVLQPLEYQIENGSEYVRSSSEA